jgi:hypothetical protein
MILFGAEIETIASRADGTIKVILGTQELSPAQVSALFTLRKKVGFVAIKEAQFQNDEMDALTDVGDDLKQMGKTPSQRMRNVLFILFKQNSEGYPSFNEFYNGKMNVYVEALKAKIAI